MTGEFGNLPTRRGRAGGGFILAVGLLFLVIATLLGLALFRGTGIMDHVAANARDKERSFEAAQSALVFGEAWLAHGNAATGTPCDGIEPSARLHVCSNTLSTTFATDGFRAGFSYQPVDLQVKPGGGIVAGGGDVNYQQAPGLYVERIGATADGRGVVYQLTTWGFGGMGTTQTVLRSVYRVDGVAAPSGSQDVQALDNP